MTDTVDRLNAALRGRYRVEGAVGEGGMALIYSAADLRHERKVALKVLKPRLAAAVGPERFLAEVKTTAGLAHPGILPLFDSGEADGLLFYVMPFIEGDSLRQRLGRERQLPVEEAVDITVQVCQALDAAHGQGVIHRDIKPENILFYSGRALVADFGIAYALTADDPERLTKTGFSLGTPYYVSPEQASGDQEPSPRSDVYSLACVLYEMLVGEPPFPGSSAQAVLMRILGGEAPSARDARGAVPENIDAAIRRALERVPADRFASAGDFASALMDPTFRHDRGTSSPRRRRATNFFSSPLFVALVTAATIAIGEAVYFAARGPESAPVIRYSIELIEAQSPAEEGQPAFGTSVTLSADGSRLVYVGSTPSGEAQLWLKSRSELTATPIPETEGMHQPALSPDGSEVASISVLDRAIRTTSLVGQPPRTLVGPEVAFRLGLTWGEDGYVYFSARPHGGIARVPASGEGDVELLSRPDTLAGERRHAWPQPLPNGRGVLITVQRGNNVATFDDDVAVLDLATGRVRVLFRGFLARYARSGHLVFVTHRGDVMGVPFDQAALEAQGQPVRILGGVKAGDRGPDFALSQSGRLVYEPDDGSGVREMVWVDRRGFVTPLPEAWSFTPQSNAGPRLSPDESSVAISIVGVLRDEIWVKRMGGPASRLPAPDIGRDPTWYADGEWILYSEGNGDRIMRRRADGTGDPELVVEHERPIIWGGSLAANDTWVVFRTFPEPSRDVLAKRLDPDSPVIPLVATEFHETSPTVSPDGRFLAYVSDESGRTEVYVRPFPDVDSYRLQVSDDGGREPVWGYRGRELFYKNESGELVAVAFATSPRFDVLGRATLFTLPEGASYSAQRQAYDVSRDDQRFLMLRSPPGGGSTELGEYLVIEGFFTVLGDLLPGG